MENDRYNELVQRLDEMEYAIDLLQRKSQKTRRELGINSMATFAFLGLLGVLLLGIRLEFGGFSFSIPLELIVKCLEVPVVAAVFAAVAKPLLDSRTHTRRRDDS